MSDPGPYLYESAHKKGSYHVGKQQWLSKPAHLNSLARAFAICSHNIGNQRMLQTKSHISGAIEWLCMSGCVCTLEGNQTAWLQGPFSQETTHISETCHEKTSLFHVPTTDADQPAQTFPFSNSQFLSYVHLCRAFITRLKQAISPYSGIVWVLFYNI